MIVCLKPSRLYWFVLHIIILFFALVSHSFMYDWLLHYGLYIAFAVCALLFYYVFFVRFHGSLSYCIEIERER